MNIDPALSHVDVEQARRRQVAAPAVSQRLGWIIRILADAEQRAVLLGRDLLVAPSDFEASGCRALRAGRHSPRAVAHVLSLQHKVVHPAGRQPRRRDFDGSANLQDVSALQQRVAVHRHPSAVHHLRQRPLVVHGRGGAARVGVGVGVGLCTSTWQRRLPRQHHGASIEADGLDAASVDRHQRHAGRTDAERKLRSVSLSVRVLDVQVNGERVPDALGKKSCREEQERALVVLDEQHVASA
eukprot:scaffold184_cov316-Pinguiococcus_pyrenoidosus.AAC.48